MKNEIIFFLLITIVISINAQVYNINFTGSGASLIVDSVQIENLNQCTKLTLNGNDTLRLINNGGIEKRNPANYHLDIFPNSNFSYYFISFETYQSSFVDFLLYNLQGQLLLKQTEQLIPGKQYYKLSSCDNGVYILQIKSKNFCYSGKIIQYNMYKHEDVKIEKLNSKTNIEIEDLSEKFLSNNKLTQVMEMEYHPGERIKFKGYSGGIYATIMMMIPTQSQTLNFNFVLCKDGDNNNYTVVQIGTQLWMAENLKTTKYSNGDSILKINDTTIWNHLSTGAYCFYNNDPSLAATYGKLYNWYALSDNRKIAPLGWHIPSLEEWSILSNYLGGDNISGGKMKANCTTFWAIPNIDASNESGFTGLPGGFRHISGVYMDIQHWGIWWYSTSINASTSYVLVLWQEEGTFNQHFADKVDGLSIRCIKD